MSLARLAPALPIPESPAPPRPLLPVAVGLCAGIWLDATLRCPGWLAGAAILGGAASLLLSRRPDLAFISLAIAAAGLGMLRHALADRRVSTDHIVGYTAPEPVLVTMTGQVRTPPRVYEPSSDVPSAYDPGPKTRFILEAQQLEGQQAPVPVSGPVAVTVKAALLFPRIGDRIRMSGWLYRPRGPSNPGQYNWARHLRREGILAGFSCAHAESVRIVERRAGRGWTGVLASARSRLRGYLLEDAFEENDEGAGVLSALVLGERSAVGSALNEAFRSTGTAHFLAASGMQIAWLGFAGWIAGRLLGLYYRTTAVLVAAMILSYGLIAEPEPSILRAVIVGLLSCAAAFFRGRYNSVNALCCAVIILLMLRPADLFTPGFQYTFLATIGLLHFYPRLSEAIAEFLLSRRLPRGARLFSPAPYPLRLFKLEDESGPTPRVAVRFAATAVAQLLALSISEWLITAPLTCYLFNQFMPWGWLGTFMLTFVVLPATLFGYLAVLAGLVFPSSGVLIGPISAFFTHGVIDCVRLLTELPWTTLSGRFPSLAWLLATYGYLFVWCYGRKWPLWHRLSAGLHFVWRRLSIRAVPKLIPVALLLWWIVAPCAAWLGPPEVRVWMLAVGDGTATIIELPDGKTLMYDFGTRSPLDVGRLGLDFLRHRGIDTIDAAIVSHADFDHYSGIAPIAKSIPVKRVLVNVHFRRFVTPESAAHQFLAAMQDLGVPVEVVRPPETLRTTGGVAVDFIWPPPPEERTFVDTNEASSVLRLRFQDQSILLTGDISASAIAGLLARGGLEADLLALPHHGAVVHNTPAFIDAVNPRIAVRSTGQRRALSTSGIERLVGPRQYFSTADDGCILVRIRDGQVTAAPAR